MHIVKLRSQIVVVKILLENVVGDYNQSVQMFNFNFGTSIISQLTGSAFIDLTPKQKLNQSNRSQRTTYL